MDNKTTNENELYNNDNNYKNECSDDYIEIATQSACKCEDFSEIKYIPDEVFYNSCDCESCKENTSDMTEEKICICGYNPMGNDNFDDCYCKFNNLNFFE